MRSARHLCGILRNCLALSLPGLPRCRLWCEGRVSQARLEELVANTLPGILHQRRGVHICLLRKHLIRRMLEYEMKCLVDELEVRTAHVLPLDVGLALILRDLTPPKDEAQVHLLREEKKGRTFVGVRLWHFGPIPRNRASLEYKIARRRIFWDIEGHWVFGLHRLQGSCFRHLDTNFCRWAAAVAHHCSECAAERLLAQ